MSITKDGWASGAYVCERLGISWPALQALATSGKIGRRAVPHAKPRYCVADVERVLRESTQVAGEAS